LRVHWTADGETLAGSVRLKSRVSEAPTLAEPEATLTEMSCASATDRHDIISKR